MKASSIALVWPLLFPLRRSLNLAAVPEVERAKRDNIRGRSRGSISIQRWNDGYGRGGRLKHQPDDRQYRCAYRNLQWC